MIVLKEESPMLILKMDNNISAFYEEVIESCIPKNIAKYMSEHNNGGSGAMLDNYNYWWSNTYGVTCNKVFKKVEEGLRLQPKNHNELLKINEIQTLDYIESILGEDVEFEMSYVNNLYHNLVSITARYLIPTDDLEFVGESEYVKHSEIFRGRHKYIISILCIAEFTDEEKSSFKESIFMNIKELKETFKNLSIKTLMFNYRCDENSYYTLSNFHKLEEVYTLNEAAELYGKSEGTLRSAIKSGKFLEKKDWRKAGRITLITKDAMERVYGKK